MCTLEKLTRTPFPVSHNERMTDLLEIVHSDVCGPFRTKTPNGPLYFVVFIDDFSQWSEVYTLKHKDEVCDIFKNYKILVENHTGRKIKYLQTDNEKEYCNAVFKTFLRENWIRRRLTVLHTPQQNGTAEKKMRTLVEMTRCLLRQHEIPLYLWGEALNTANYIRNRCPTEALAGKIPYVIWTGKTPSYRHFQIFGTLCFILNKNPSRGKFDSKSVEGIFVGYSDIAKAYRVWIAAERKIIVSRDVKFTNTTEPVSSEWIDLNTLVNTSPSS